MNRSLVVALLVLAVPGVAIGQTRAPRPAKTVVNYGANRAAGATFTHDGVTLYYEVYGTGDPILVVHGNGGSIADVSAQIEHFRQGHRVVAMDSRDQGRSGDSPGPITYEKMADDLAALLDHLNTGPVSVLGWSDGGIEALLLGIRHPGKVKKIAAMAANLNPSEQALYPEVSAMARSMMDAVPPAARDTPQGRRELKVTQMLLDEPHIVFHHLPNAQLCIFSNATHMVPFDEPARFNAEVDRFFRAPFVKKDRIKDFMSSFEKMRAAQQPR